LRARRTFAIAIIQTLIALIWFGPYFVPKPAREPSSPTLRVITFNVWGYNARLDQVETWLRETDADIVLLQEIPEYYANNTGTDLSDLYPYQLSQPKTVRRWGNLILSRFPILTAQDLPGDGVPAQQRFAVDFEGQTLAIYNVHLAMPVGQRRLPAALDNFVLQAAVSYSDSARNGEIHRLLDRLDSEVFPYIVAGDFNMSEHAVIYTVIDERMNDAFREMGTGWGGSWPVQIVDELPPYLPPLLRVDYIWHSAQFRTIEAYRGPELGSDHLPFVAELEIPTDHR
jgi:endonuclease/exonuclease/phosphatase (EEP) superfamily protein YafD